MYEPNKGIHFVSGQCALCNHVTEAIPWGGRLECGPTDRDTRAAQIESGFINSTESFNDALRIRDCTFIYKPPVGSERPCYEKDVVSTCPSNCANEELVRRCESGHQSLTGLERTVYWNVYCAACNARDDNVKTSDLTCGFYTRFPSGTGTGIDRFRPEGSFSLTLVFDFNPRRGLTVGQHLVPDCSTGEVYVSKEDSCRPITCSPGFMLEMSECIPESSNMTVVVTGTLAEGPPSPITLRGRNDHLPLTNNIRTRLFNLLTRFNVTYHRLDLLLNTSIEDKNFKIQTIIQCNCDFGALQIRGGNGSSESLTELEELMGDEVRKRATEFLLEKGFHVRSVGVTIPLRLSDQDQSFSSPSAGHNCTWLVYQANETEVSNSSVTVSITGKVYTTQRYWILDDQTVLVCDNFTEKSNEDVLTTDLALSVTTVVCVGVSILCLIVRIVLQACVPSFQNNPGTLHLQLTIALLLTYIVLIVGPFFSGHPQACTVVAVLLAYAFLATFTWMNVIALDTCLVFRPSSALSKAKKRRPLILHFFLGWGIPFLLVLIPGGVFFSGLEGNFSPDFGGPRCWFTRRYAMLLFFGIPVAASVTMNIVIYVYTSLSLHRSFKNSERLVQSKKYHFGTYIRLFVLMGVTWIFGFVSAFTDEFTVDLIFVILTSLQGLFLFVSVVCTKRVLKDLRTLLGREPDSGLDKATTSSPLQNSDLSGKGASRV